MKHLENQIRQCLDEPSMILDPASCEQTLWLAKRELHLRQNRPRIRYFSFLIMQMRYTGIRIWLAQALILALTIAGLWNLFSDPFFYTPRNIARILYALGLLIFLSTIPFIHRSFQYRMAETEAAARFSAIHLLCARLIIIGIGDMAIIGSIIAVTASRTSFSPGSALLYLIVPLLASCCAGLYLSRHLKMIHFPYYCGIICLFMAGLILIFGKCYPRCLEQTFSARWLIICALLLFICAYQFRHLCQSPVDA